MHRYFVFALAIATPSALTTAGAFCPGSAAPARIAVRETPVRRLGLALDPALLDVGDMTVSRTAFFLCFFGATGSAAVGRAVIPVTWEKWQATQALKGAGSSLGGPELEVFGYPEPVYENDIKQMIGNINNMTIPEIVQSFPIEDQIPGYLRYESLVQANPDVKPMAVRVLFDSMALGINKNQIAPRVAMERLEAYQNDLSLIGVELTKVKTVGVTALVILLGLLGAADYFSVYHLWKGWFPLWPGFAHFPGSLFSMETGFAAIPSYWVGEIPDKIQQSGAFPM